jgi:large subunit ribosomal protein L15
MQLHNLKRNTKNKKEKLVGRGGKHAKTSGRGGKGQTARAGNKKRPQMRDIIKKLPKLRGYKFNSTKNKNAVVNLGALAGLTAGTVVTPQFLLEHSLIRRVSGKLPVVKVLGLGELTTKLTFTGVIVSASAKTKIEKAGGTITEKL